ncbi:hypothetical protein BRADI_1g44015v3 [Brachypodium distachyon]|uniref:Uncharacterized protein n=1 Tax=Brachypodium distachyon TaxID=15368 RepID=A0A0Q3H7R7_BRADI|nr:hypothetical protein BRADI_1g44015v3 [Brachypodium distachyon]
MTWKHVVSACKHQLQTKVVFKYIANGVNVLGKLPALFYMQHLSSSSHLGHLDILIELPPSRNRATSHGGSTSSCKEIKN